MCEEVRGETPCEEHVLNLLAMVYKPLGHRDRWGAVWHAVDGLSGYYCRVSRVLFLPMPERRIFRVGPFPRCPPTDCL